MEPKDLVEWAICIAIAGFILSALGVQDWIAENIFKQETKKSLKSKINDLENRVLKLEKELLNKSSD